MVTKHSDEMLRLYVGSMSILGFMALHKEEMTHRQLLSCEAL